MDSYSADLVVVGAGAPGLLAATAARRLGDDVVVVDASPLAGGNAASGTGQMWLPANPLMGEANLADSSDEANEYLQALLGSPRNAASASRRAAFVRTAPKLARWLLASHVPLTIVKSGSDFYPVLPGGKESGRTVQVGALDRRVLGETDNALARHTSRWQGTLDRLPMSVPLRRPTTSGGESLVAHLLHRAVANGVELWLDSPVTGLLHTDDRVTGVIVNRDGVSTEITAKRVLLASGGFERSTELRDEYLPLPTQASWTTTDRVACDGSVMRLATELGADVANMDDAWWMPVVLIDDQAYPVDQALGAPHGLLVDSVGDRFVDETSSPYEIGQAMYDHSRAVRAVPSFLVIDNRHRQSTLLGPWAAGSTPKPAIAEGAITRASTLNDLAQATGLDRACLLGSVVRFNTFANKGHDSDFNRGQGEDSGHKKRKNPALGKIDKTPFWAIKVYPGDTGTRGGLVVDEHGRVLRSDATAIAGLYACTGAAASFFTGAPPAPGAQLAESLVGAFLAVTDQRKPSN